MSDPQTSYFFKKFYRNIIKWWFVAYNPDVKKIWPSKEEEEAALEAAALSIDDDSYNAATGSHSGLYGQGPVDDDKQDMLEEILNKASSQSSIDSLVGFSSKKPFHEVTLPPEQDDVIAEAKAIYDRLMREAKADEEKRIAEIAAARDAVQAQGI